MRPPLFPSPVLPSENLPSLEESATKDDKEENEEVGVDTGETEAVNDEDEEISEGGEEPEDGGEDEPPPDELEL